MMMSYPVCLPSRRPGFTLAELLIALAILGVIATFTIPKVLQSQQDAEFKSIAKEGAGMISGAFKAYQLQNTLSADTYSKDLTPYMNYVSLRTSNEQIDSHPPGTFKTCNASNPCIVLHSGAVMELMDTQFGATASTAAVGFTLDPDGVYSGTTDGPGKAVRFYLFSNGRLTTRANITSDTYTKYAGTYSTIGAGTPSMDPTWFDWD